MVPAAVAAASRSFLLRPIHRLSCFLPFYGAALSAANCQAIFPPPPPTSVATPLPPGEIFHNLQSMSEDDGSSGSPPTGPIVGSVLAGLIVIFGLVILFRLVLRRRGQKPESERPLHDVEKAVVDKRLSADCADAKSLAHTIDHTEEADKSASPNHSGLLHAPPDTKQEEAQQLVLPLAPKASSSKPTARLSANSEAETQSISAMSFATAMQSQRNSASLP